MGIFPKMNKSHNYSQAEMCCDRCGRVMETDDFIAILARVPSRGHNIMKESTIDKWIQTAGGTTYCKQCFENKYRMG